MSATIDLIDKRIQAIEAHIVDTMTAIWENTESTPGWAAEMLSERDELFLDRGILAAEELQMWEGAQHAEAAEQAAA